MFKFHTYSIVMVLVGISILASVSNEFFIKFFNKGELYPFTHWKLYTMPFGNKYYAEDLRFYGFNSQTHQWDRIPIKPSPTLNKVEMIYAINAQAKYPIDQKKKANLRYLASALAPEYQRFKLILECYDQRNLIRSNTLFDTLAICEF